MILFFNFVEKEIRRETKKSNYDSLTKTLRISSAIRKGVSVFLRLTKNLKKKFIPSCDDKRFNNVDQRLRSNIRICCQIPVVCTFN